MDWVYAAALRVIAAVALIYFGLGLFNVSWLMRVRAIASLAVGAALLGGLGWPLVKPDLPETAVSVMACSMTIPKMLMLALLAFGSGFAAYFVSWPAGRIFAPYAAPMGMAVWAMAGGLMQQLIMDHHDAVKRAALYAALRWEGLLWLALGLAGYVGVLAAATLCGHRLTILIAQNDRNGLPLAKRLPTAALALVASGVIAWLAVGFLVQDIRQPDPQLGSVLGQPGARQIAFGVFASFCLAAYAVKYLLKVAYTPVVLAAPMVSLAAMHRLLSAGQLDYLAQNWSAAYFSNAITAITPLQMVAFGTLGAITGYWMVVKFNHWDWKSH